MTDSTRRRARAATIALPALLAVLVGTAGCGSEAHSVVDSGDKVSVSSDKAETGSETGQGTVTAGGDLPEGFPRDAVPLIDATVVTGTKGEPGGEFAWSVVMRTTRAIDDVAAEVKKDFTAAGYRTRQADEMGDVTIMQFAGPTYRVGVTATRTAGAVTVTYLVNNR